MEKVFKNVIPTSGEGIIKLGTHIELNENVYAILFVSLYKQEYENAYDLHEELHDSQAFDS